MSNPFEKLAEKIGVVVQAGGILNIENFNFNDKPKQKRPQSEIILLQQIKVEVLGLLNQSLYNLVLANSEKEKKNDLVRLLWSLDIKIFDQEHSNKNDVSTGILEVFDQEEISGKLLILGDPGVGKTINLLELARGLALRSEANPLQPIPVLLNLISWHDDRQSFLQWVTNRIKKKYGLHSEEVTDLIKKRRLVFLLDGQDEISPFYQKSFVLALNQFLSSEYRPSQIAVSSRFKEYAKLNVSLSLNGAVYIKSLTHAQIREYLSQINRPEIWLLLQNSNSLLDLSKIPLFLNLIIVSNIGYARHLSSTNDLHLLKLDDLLDLYVERMLGEKRNHQRQIISGSSILSKTSKKQILYLNWLAREMKRGSKVDWMIEDLTPELLHSKSNKKLYFLFISLFLGLPVGAAYSLILEDFVIALNSGLGLPSHSFLSLLLDNAILVAVLLGLLGSFFLMFLLENVGQMFEGSDQSIFGFIFRILSGISLALVSGSSFGIFLVLLTGHPIAVDITTLLFLTGGILFGVVGDVNTYIDIYELNSPSLQKTVLGILTGTFTGLFIGLLTSNPRIGFISSVVAIILFGSVGILLGAINHRNIYLLSTPNQGILSMLRNSIVVGLFSAVLSGVVVGSITKPTYGLASSLITFLFYFLISGGKACLQHFVIRLILYFRGYIPWNYSRFLNQSTSNLILQRVGGRYRFIHKLLQEHFASRPLEISKPKILSK